MAQSNLRAILAPQIWDANINKGGMLTAYSSCDLIGFSEFQLTGCGKAYQEVLSMNEKQGQGIESLRYYEDWQLGSFHSKKLWNWWLIHISWKSNHIEAWFEISYLKLATRMGEYTSDTTKALPPSSQSIAGSILTQKKCWWIWAFRSGDMKLPFDGTKPSFSLKMLVLKHPVNFASYWMQPSVWRYCIRQE